mmetsp:Transcript_73233/g.156902  ORF Transcript_73233/g.156902 Transcript_73233/m.156902 type:complete len:531 (-) Transcript_73233:48-1640(-)
MPATLTVLALCATAAYATYPGPAWIAPKIHHSPDCLHKPGWHDVAGALTFKGTHHVFQGCPSDGGWSHAASQDLVHWEDRGIHVKAIHETYEGMDSTAVPCSGFVVVNDQNVPCAGFRQCGSHKGTTGLNPEAHAWDVPLEVRCAKNDDLTEWGENQYLFPFYYYRALPYDPVRPWKDTDGKWYVAMSTDGCNSTTKKRPCAAGGRLDLFTAPSFDGPWEQLPAMFTTNVTISGQVVTEAITAEFVTSGYFGGLPGDPANGMTRVVTQNNPNPTFWVGQQSNGGPFEPFWDKLGAVGHYDYGSLTMARTLGSDPNQVALNGRRVLVGWIGGRVASQSLPRDLSLSANYELLQAFVPELQVLRQSNYHLASWNVPSKGSMQLEVLASFTFNVKNPPTTPFGVEVLRAQDGNSAARLQVDCSKGVSKCTVGVNATSQHDGKLGLGPLLPLLPMPIAKDGEVVSVRVHAIVDHAIVEAIFNNRTAMAVYAMPAAATDTNVILFSSEPDKVITELDMWELSSIEAARSEQEIIL